MEQPDKNRSDGDRPATGDTKRMGMTMTVLAIGLFLGMMTWMSQVFLDKQRNPNSAPETRLGDRGVREVVLQPNRRGMYFASGQIDSQDVEFLLDTGATYVSVPGDTAQRLGLEAGGAYKVQTANGLAEVYATKLSSVRIGNIELRNVRGHINPHMDGDQEVLLGMSFLKQLDLIQRGDSLTLRQY